MYKSNYLLMMFILSFLLTFNSSLTISNTDYVFSDAEDDVMEIIWDEGATDGIYTGTFKTVSSKPDYDILGLDYQVTNEGDVIITLTVKGEIQSENSYYWIKLIDSANSFQIDIWYGLGWSAATDGKNAGYTYVNGSKLGVGEIFPTIAGAELSMTLSNVILFGSLENVIVEYPTQVSSDSEWHVSTWNGDDIGTNNGTWYLDYGPDADNKYDDFLTPYTAATFGFEFIPLISSFIFIYYYKKRKNQKY